MNDTLGHGTGDALIKAVAERLRTLAGASDCVARIGGDEFVILQVESADEVSSTTFATEIVDALAHRSMLPTTRSRSRPASESLWHRGTAPISRG